MHAASAGASARHRRQDALRDVRVQPPWLQHGGVHTRAIESEVAGCACVHDHLVAGSIDLIAGSIDLVAGSIDLGAGSIDRVA